MPKKELQQVVRELPKGARRVARLGEGLTKFVEGEEIRGIFIQLKESQIKDRRTKELKMIRVYTIQLSDNTMARIGSRSMLDDAFDEMVELLGGIDNMKGKDISFIRGADVETSDGNPMGTYEVIVY
jgi:hypothetical protein